MNEYNKQAADFLEKFCINFRATLKDSKLPLWASEKDAKAIEAARIGHHYKITLSKLSLRSNSKSVSFDFRGSLADRDAGVTSAKPYDVLSCLSGDIRCPETFEEFCSEYGYNADSIAALKMFQVCRKLARKLRAFFSAEAQEALSEIV